MKSIHRQGRFFAVGIALVITVVFGATTAAIVAIDDGDQGTVATQPQTPAGAVTASVQPQPN
ncbi:MAG: hypothetical protein M5U08_23500 [Burkholderiales bacterium]|nr:hypothetical protein [Burkholderiales bacterium]